METTPLFDSSRDAAPAPLQALALLKRALDRPGTPDTLQPLVGCLK